MRAAALVVLALVDAFAPPQRAVAPSIILHGSKVGVYYGTEGQIRQRFTGELLNAKFDGIAGETSFPVDEIDESNLMDHELCGGLPGVEHWADTKVNADWDGRIMKTTTPSSTSTRRSRCLVRRLGGYGNFCV